MTLPRDNTTAALDWITGLTAQLRTLIPAATAALELQLGADGHASNRGYDKAHGGTSDTTSVEAATLKRLDVNDDNELADLNARQLEAIGTELNAATLILRNLHRDCLTHIRMGRPIPPQDGGSTRCDGGAGREGFMIPASEGGWSNPACERVPGFEHKTCDRCIESAAEWRKARDRAADAARFRKRYHHTRPTSINDPSLTSGE